jgi:hypothetical protein
MALKNVIVGAALVASATAFGSSRVEERLTLNDGPAKKTEKKATPKKVIETLHSGEAQKNGLPNHQLPKNARHDATAGVFI